MEEFVVFLSRFLSMTKADIRKCFYETSLKLGITSERCAKALIEIVDETKMCSHYSTDKSLFDYQQKVVEHFYSNRGIVAAFATGTGKTFTAVATAVCMHKLSSVFGAKCKILIVTPASLADNMREEFVKFPYKFGKDLTIISSNVFRDIMVYHKRLNAGENKIADIFMKRNSKRADIICDG